VSEALRNRIERHAAGAENLADAMAKDGVGLADRTGFVSILRRIASDLRQQSALGVTPSGFNLHAAAGKRVSAQAEHVIRRTGLAFLLDDGNTDTIALADLNHSLAETGVTTADRMVVKELLASCGKITTA
jgi:hypothetical protein